MITHEWARRFATEWVEAWNAHDLERVLAHYTDDFEMSSPFIVSISGEGSGTLKGKARVAEYWRTALERMPDLRFELLQVLAGAGSVTLCYKSVLGMLSAEVLFINEDGKVYKALAHYDRAPDRNFQSPEPTMSSNQKPVAIKAADAPPRTKATNYPEPFASRMAGREKRPLGDLFGLTNFGVNLTRLSPNAVTSLRHTHSKQDEFFYILQGNPILHTDEGRTRLSPGMCAGFKAGMGNGHCFINDTSEDVLILIVGDRTPGDEGSYPDDDLKAALVDGGWAFTHKDGTPYE